MGYLNVFIVLPLNCSHHEENNPKRGQPLNKFSINRNQKYFGKIDNFYKIL